MAYCSKCGSQVNDGDQHCPYCGAAQQSAKQPHYNAQGTQVVTVDNGGPLWFLIGFCVPIVGLILFLIYSKEKPNTAKSAGMGALVSVILSAVFTIISLLSGGFMAGM